MGLDSTLPSFIISERVKQIATCQGCAMDSNFCDKICMPSMGMIRSGR